MRMTKREAAWDRKVKIMGIIMGMLALYLYFIK